jgi:hypothetical protein
MKYPLVDPGVLEEISNDPTHVAWIFLPCGFGGIYSISRSSASGCSANSSGSVDCITGAWTFVFLIVEIFLFDFSGLIVFSGPPGVMSVFAFAFVVFIPSGARLRGAENIQSVYNPYPIEQDKPTQWRNERIFITTKSTLPGQYQILIPIALAFDGLFAKGQWIILVVQRDFKRCHRSSVSGSLRV